MGYFVKKPIVVEAVQFTGENWDEMDAFCGLRRLEGQTEMDARDAYADVFTSIGSYLPADEHLTAAGELWVEANKTVLPIETGEWVIKDSLGFYPCKDDKFKETYGEASHEQVGQYHLKNLEGDT